MNGKSGSRDDDMDGFERPRRRGHEEDEADTRPRRDHDRPRWGPRESQSDTPWAKRDKYVDSDERDGPAWRRTGRDKDRDFERADPEPEWVDSVETADSKTQHTQADFKEWMEQMKKKGAAETPSHSAQAVPIDSSAKDLTSPAERPPARVFSDSAASVDRFFAKFEEKQTAADTNVAAKPTKSRFASIFGSKEEPKPEAQITPPTTSVSATLTALFTNPSQPAAVELEQPPVAVEKDKKANDEAFAKLIQMLSKNQAGSAPTPSQVPASKTPVNISELAAVRSPESRSVGPAHAQANRTPVTHTPNLSIDRLIESRSPAQKPKSDNSNQHKATSQDLLDLLRRSKLQEEQPPTQYNYPVMQEQRMPHPPPGLGNYPNRDFDRQQPLISTRREAPRSIYDDPVFGGYRGEPVYQQRSPPPDAHMQGGPGGLFAGMNDRAYPPSNRDEHRAPMPGMVNPPPGLQRPPPGLDGNARPPQPPPGSGWPPTQQRAPMPQYGLDTQQPPYPQNRNIYQQSPQGPPQTQQQYPIRGDYGRYMQR